MKKCDSKAKNASERDFLVTREFGGWLKIAFLINLNRHVVEFATLSQDCFYTNLHEGGKDLSQKHEANKNETDLKLFSEMILSWP